ncbi:hypothetical protein CW713_02955 [Methanophagales archaeon]|nr:MAG: hypothetical protein CW713_02955 [Methanophagales archaeon]
MEDVVLRELETLAKERKEDVATIIAKAVKIGIEKIRQDTILERYLKKAITREEAIKLVGMELVRLAERQREAVLEDVKWGLHG